MTPSGFLLPSSGTQIGLGLLGSYPYSGVQPMVINVELLLTMDNLFPIDELSEILELFCSLSVDYSSC